MAEKAAGGYMGKVLRVDLSNEKISVESLDDATRRKYVGGTAMGTMYLYREVPQGVAWSDAENRIMFFAGPLNGTKVNGTGTFSVVTKGPMTNLAVATTANGYFGAYLKFAGFDGIVVHGRARGWRYLYIHDGTAELRDAEHLRGKDTRETEDTIKSGLKKQSSVCAIGPAGENLVRFAAIVSDHGHVAGHNGVGAVMGSKKLKAIAVERGNQEIPVAEPDRLAGAAAALVEDATAKDPNMGKYGTAFGYPILAASGQLPVRNYTTSIFPDAEKFSGQYLRSHFKVKTVTCWGCRIAHLREVEITEGPYKGFVGEEPEYEALAAMSAEIGQHDPAATMVLCDKIDRLGMDVNETGHLFGWLMECYEKGFIKKEDFDGVEMTWGNVNAVREMLEKIAHRRGCGDTWAEGVKRSAEKIGGEAMNCAIYTKKGASPRGHDHRGRWTELMDTCTSNTGTVEIGPGLPFTEVLGLGPGREIMQDRFNGMLLSRANAKVNGVRQFQDCLIICFFCAQDFPLLLECVNAATGWDFNIQEAMDVGRRVINQLRVFNFRHGLTKEVEAPSLRYGSAPVDGPAQGKTILPEWEAYRRNYYKNMDWDPETGQPLPATLERLGLADLIPDLEGLGR
jgi:aldehyde:ferredoxin oxidoreductase